MFRRILPCLVLTVACKTTVEVGSDYTLTLDLVAASEQDPLADGDVALRVDAGDGDVQVFELGPASAGSWEVVDLGALDGARLSVFTVPTGSPTSPVDWSSVGAWGQSAPLSATTGDTVDAPVLLPAWGTVGTYGVFDGLDASFGSAAVRLSSGDVLLFGGTDDAVVDGLTPSGSEADDRRALASRAVYRWSLADGGVFTRVADLPTVGSDVGPERVFASAVVVTVDGREQVLVTGGRRQHGAPGVSSLGSALLWDPAADEVTWTGTLQRSDGLSQHESFRLPTGDVLLVGGFADLDVRVLTHQTWSVDDKAASAVGSVDGPGPIGFAAAQLLDGSVLVCGGGVGARGSVVLTPRDGCATFDGNGLGAGATPLADGVADRGNATRMWHAAVTLADGRVLVSGGVSASVGGVGDAANAPALDDAFLYDPGSRTWSRTGKLSTARAMHRMVALADGTALVIGGTTQGTGMPASIAPTALSSVERYDPSSGTFTDVNLSAAGGGGLPTLAGSTGPAADLGYGVFLLSGMRPGADAPAWGLTPTGFAD